MRPNETDITNKRFGYLTAIKKIGPEKWLFKCDCGNKKIILKRTVVHGESKSCGCKTKELQYRARYKDYKYKRTPRKSGYVLMRDVEDKRNTYEHRFLLKKQIKEHSQKMEVHHIDGDKNNNRLNNLLLVTREEHRRIHSGWKKIDNQWYKNCPGCLKFLEINKDNFYIRKSGKGKNKPLPRCKKCCLKQGKIQFKKWYRSKKSPLT